MMSICYIAAQYLSTMLLNVVYFVDYVYVRRSGLEGLRFSGRASESSMGRCLVLPGDEYLAGKA